MGYKREMQHLGRRLSKSASKFASALLASTLAAVCMGSPIVAAQAQWQAAEIIRAYAIGGKTGAELYASIGAHGPKGANRQRAIAHTSFKLTWSRDYQRRGDACVLASARPTLTITYVLPKPSVPLPAEIRDSWERFIAGVRDHERQHGALIQDLVRQIEAASIGLTVP
eukprot:gene68113-93319_t